MAGIRSLLVTNRTFLEGVPDWAASEAGSSFPVQSLLVLLTFTGNVSFFAAIETISEDIALLVAIFVIMIMWSTFETKSTFRSWAFVKHMFPRPTFETSFFVPFLFLDWHDEFFLLLEFLLYPFLLVNLHFLLLFLGINNILIWSL